MAKRRAAAGSVRQTVAQIAERLSSSWQVAIYPDHPHVYYMPHVLAGRAGQLAGFFVAGLSDIRHPSRLLAKLAVARLCLPSYTKLAVVLPYEMRLERRLSSNFDAVFNAREISSVEVPVEPANQKLRHHDLVAVQTKINTRYAAFLREGASHWSDSLVEDAIGDARLRLFEEVSRDSPHKRRRAPGGFSKYEFERCVIATSNYGNEGRLDRRIADLTLDAFHESYSLDGGIPYPSRTVPYVLLVDEWPRSRLDPAKPARSAAFAGIVLAHFERKSDLSKFANRLAKISRAVFE